MKYEPVRLKEPSARIGARIRRIERDFHERAFGEEMARVNWELTPAERRAYLEWMRTNALRHGVPPTLNYSVGWMVKLEEKLSSDSSG